MEKKQTAVAWIISKIALRDNSPFQAIAFYNDNKELIEQAKAMEKEHMIKFALNLHNVDMSKTGTDILTDEAEQYYKITYGN